MSKSHKDHPPTLTVKELANLLNCTFKGKGSTEIRGFSSLEKARKGELVFLSHKKFRHLLEKTQASAAIIPSEEKFDRIPVRTRIKGEVGCVSLINSGGEASQPIGNPELQCQRCTDPDVGSIRYGLFHAVDIRELTTEIRIVPIVRIHSKRE